MNMLFSITFLQFDTLFYLCFNLNMREFDLKNNIRASRLLVREQPHQQTADDGNEKPGEAPGGMASGDVEPVIEQGDPDGRIAPYEERASRMVFQPVAGVLNHARDEFHTLSCV